MKRTKLLALILVIAIMMMGAGYAAWQETLTINSNVSTGELNMEFVNQGIHPMKGSFDNKPLQRDYFKIQSFNQNEAEDKVTISVSGMYPGATFFYELRADNKGTIPATVESVTVDLTNTNDSFDDTMRVSGWILHRRPGVLFSINKVKLSNVKLSELQSHINQNMTNWKIELNDYIVFDLPSIEEDPNVRDELAEIIPGYNSETSNCLFFHLPLTAGNDIQDLPAQDFSIKFNFKQFNK